MRRGDAPGRVDARRARVRRSRDTRRRAQGGRRHGDAPRQDAAAAGCRHRAHQPFRRRPAGDRRDRVAGRSGTSPRTARAGERTRRHRLFGAGSSVAARQLRPGVQTGDARHTPGRRGYPRPCARDDARGGHRGRRRLPGHRPRDHRRPRSAGGACRHQRVDRSTSLKITMVGAGYVGLVTGTCFAEVGNNVLCVDVDTRKIDVLQGGGVPIHEPGLAALVRRNVEAGRLRFTTDVAAGVAHGALQFIAVGTPPDEDGSADMQYVIAAAREIGRRMDGWKVVVDKSTVPVGTADRVRAAIAAELATRNADIPFAVVSNPEFLKEGAAVEDFMRPDRIVIGADDERAIAAMRTIYAPFQRNRERLMVMDVRSAELTKYAANAMLATRISFMNELANLAERLGADIEMVRQGIGSDPRIGADALA